MESNQRSDTRFSSASLLVPVMAAALLLSGGCASTPTAATEDAQPAAQPVTPWISMFNGENLNGWTPKITGYALGENFGNTFRVENGVMKVAYDQYDVFGNRFGHLFYKTPYSSYKMRIEYRFTGEQARSEERRVGKECR